MTDIFKLLPLHVWRSAGLSDPQLAAWCSWDPIVESEDDRQGAVVAAELIGHLVGGSIGGAVGRLAASQVSPSEVDTDGRLYLASLGVLVLTENAVVIVDCGYRVGISENGVRQRHVEKFLRSLRGEPKFKLWNFERAGVRASLRKDGRVLRLGVHRGSAWLLQIARIEEEADARAFVRAIQYLPEVPTSDEFMALAVNQPPSASVLDAMAMDGTVDEVLRRLVELDRERLGRLLGNVSECRSSAFAVRIEGWLVERASPASKGNTDWMMAIALGVVCLGYAIFKPAAHASGMRWVGIGATVILLAVAYVWRLQAEEARWFAEQLVQFRAARMRRT